jgi:outer membrane receptor protein involved in Fe transport
MSMLGNASLALAAVSAAGVSEAEPAAVQLAQIVVKGQAIAAEAQAYSVTELTTADIRQENVANFDELLREVPGMTVRDFGLGGVANSIVIRGFGGGGHGGDLGAVLDGIPLNEAMSHADGYVDLNVIIPLEVESLTVYRGPVSALYGNYNRGGLLSLRTRKSGDYVDADASIGSHETANLQVALGKPIGDRHRLNLAAQAYFTDGYRPQSDVDRQTVSGRWAFDLTPKVEVAISGRYHRTDADSASYLTMAQFLDDPYGIDPRVQNDGAEKEFGTLRLDVNAELGPDTKLLTFAYLTKQDFTRWFTRPVGGGVWRQREETYDRDVFGAGGSLNGKFTVFDGAAPWNYVIGVETFREQTDFQYYDGVDNRMRVAPAANDRETRLSSISAFAEVEAPLHDLLKLSLGLRGDWFAGGCELLGPETGADPCGDLNDVNELSPKVGVRSSITSWLELRANWSKGFALPPGFIKYAGGGAGLDPNVFRQIEIGATVTPLPDFKLDVAAFRLKSSNEIRTVIPGVYENFGSTLRRGIEASLDWAPVDSFRLRAVYGFTDTEVTENANPALIGNGLSGVPRHSANLEAYWSPIDNWTIDVNWRYVGKYQVNAQNTLQADSYNTVDLGLAYEGTAPVPFRAFVRVDNLTDEKYATSVFSIGGETVVAPGAPRTARIGVQLSL